jgi:glutamate N-acetyltransferase / amino-acid N-acetyltransferase
MSPTSSDSGVHLPSLHLPAGFKFSALAAGLKPSGRPDLALIEACPGTCAAALFTRNQVVAAPVQLARSALASSHGRVRAVLVNSGNANCGVGAEGLSSCKRVCGELACLLGIRSGEVFPSSTGVIGVRFPVERICSKLPALIRKLEASERGITQLAKAIMTTDTRPKLASSSLGSRQATVNLLGVAKGSGMIHPQLATMLVYLLTDLSAGPDALRRLLRRACAGSFQCISVDGDTSTNDTVLLLASGKSGVRLSHPGVRERFSAALSKLCQSLAEQIVADGEGGQHVIRLKVQGAKSKREAEYVARAVANSLLVKTAWAGADPNWGRILAAIGTSGVKINPKRISIAIGNQWVCRRGTAVCFDAREAHRELARRCCDIHIGLGQGSASLSFLTTDLTGEYVRINAEYST